ncbi:hypothetical protein FRB94_009798 [Tulasnella sp. JGI-2019a]|nr:hypothetical protein FRB93_002885 [Tulasnella sp. JGI-2019a]KAG8994551.1 hypothetical protein FRB94_009798 [Tulasnella sp. JGI-2019a]
MLFTALSSLLLCSATVVLAVPLKEEKRSGVTAVAASTIPTWTPYEWFAAAAYCTNGASTWSCGTTCQANSDFVQYAAGGDGAATPHWYVGWSPSLASIIVAHEGTDPTEFLSDLDDIEVLQSQPSTSYFPGISSGIWIHDGFLGTFESTAAQVLAGVKTVSAAKSSSKVTVVGHSLGGALANLDGVFLKLNIPSLTVKIVTFGEPRVGNQAWADYASTFDITRITHSYDPIPIVPGRALGYHHPSGEVHVNSAGTWNYCAGEDNTDTNCSTGEVPNIFVSDILDHLGPYGPSSVWMGTIYC